MNAVSTYPTWIPVDVRSLKNGDVFRGIGSTFHILAHRVEHMHVSNGATGHTHINGNMCFEHGTTVMLKVRDMTHVVW
jgi:hypothetical protein